MSHELQEGVKLESIFWPEGELKVGHFGVVSITVVEQRGQMGMLPTFHLPITNGTNRYQHC